MKKSLTCFLVISSFVVLGHGLCAQEQTAFDYDTLVHQGNAQLQAGNNDLALTTANSAIKLSANRWEAYALAGGALLNLKRYEDAADDFSLAIDHAPDAKQQALRDLRKRCLVAEMGQPAPAIPAPASQPTNATTSQSEIALWKSIENSTKSEDFKAYLAQYPNGTFATLAKERLEKVEKVNISADVAASLLLQKSEPVYPPIAKAAHVSGTVVLQATISEMGSVEGLRVISGPPMLQSAALETVRKWRYKPYLVNDEPKGVETTVNVVFTLRK